MKPWHALAPAALALSLLLPQSPATAFHVPRSPKPLNTVYAASLLPSPVNLGAVALATVSSGPTIQVTINGAPQQLALPSNLKENTTYTIQLFTVVNGEPVVLPPVSFYINTAGNVVNTPAPAPSEPTQSAAVRLEDALHNLQIAHVSMLFAYLESIQLTPFQVAQIKENAAALPGLFGNVSNPNQLTLAQKEAAVNLFVTSAHDADLTVVPVLATGQKVNLLTYTAVLGDPLEIDLDSEQGQTLAVIQPEYYDVATPYLESFINNVAIAASAAYQLEHSGQFVEIPHGQLP